jgi:signal transduction histidine kinase
MATIAKGFDRRARELPPGELTPSKEEENEMKKFFVATLVLLVCVGLPALVLAESATQEECIAKSKEAAQMLQEKGLDTAVAAINDKEGPFVWKDTYVFLMNMDGKMLAHPMSPALLEKDSLLEVKDANDKALFVEFVNVAAQGEGWVDYVWPKPGEEAPSPKSTYIYQVPGTQYFVGAGIYK